MKIQQNDFWFLPDILRRNAEDSFRNIEVINHPAVEVYHTTADDFHNAEEIRHYTDEMIRSAEELFRSTDGPFRGRNIASVLRKKATGL